MTPDSGSDAAPRTRNAMMTSASRLPAVSPQVLLAALVAVYLVLACAYSAVTPPPSAGAAHNPDEWPHLLYVREIAGGHLPVFRAGGADYEAHQPPLYYALCAPVYLAVRGSGDANAARAVRGVSIVLGALLVVATFLCAAALFPKEPLWALGAAAFVALLPMNVSLCASVGNDVLTNLVMAAGLWRLVRVVMAAPVAPPSGDVRQALWLGVVLGVGVWTKTSTLLLFPTVALAFYLLVRQKCLAPARAWRMTLVSCGLGVLLGMPWLVRNQILYGDPVARHLFINAFQNTAKADVLLQILGSVPFYLFVVARWTFASFWGVFDSMTLFWNWDPLRKPPTVFVPLGPIYKILEALTVLAGAGLLQYVRGRKIKLSVEQGLVWWTFGALVTLTGLSFLSFVLVFFQAQGRYWYPALVPLALFFVLGWRGLLSPRGFAVFLGLIILGLIVLNGYTLLDVLRPRFAGL